LHNSTAKKYENQAAEDDKGFDVQLRKAFNSHVNADIGYTYTLI